MSIDPALERALAEIAFPGTLIGHRIIAPGDEAALLPEEARSISTSVGSARRASGAARILGRELLGRLGLGAVAIPKGPDGAPVWPAGISGSFAHDERVTVAVIGRTEETGSLGIDVEPAFALPAETLDLVATAAEKSRLGEDPYRGRLLFAAKEAVYKAAHPLDGQFLEFHDIEVDFDARRAHVRNGRSVDLRFCVSTHLVALARTR